MVMCDNKIKRVSDLIDIDSINLWSENSVINIKAGTGVGKSYFIKNVLYSYAKESKHKILFLIHRSNCKDQFKLELEEDNKKDYIHIETYQGLEYKIMNKKIESLDEYKYIVCDEFHYFLSDSAFSKTTDISLDFILNLKDKIKIFMSATGDYVEGYLKHRKGIDTTKYELPISYAFINNLTFFNKEETLEDLIEDCISNNKKAIFFIQSATKAYELYTKYKDKAIFNCSKSNSTYYKHVNTDVIDKMLKESKFDELLLISTACMDAGTNIIDDDLKMIVCDIEDTGSLIQCIGRKRLQSSEETIDVYIKTISNNRLGGKETQLNNKIKKAEFLKTHTVKEYIEKFPRSSNDYSNIVYDEVVEAETECTKKINELMYYKVKCDLCEIEDIKNIGGYTNYISNLFEKSEYSVIEVESVRNELESYLESVLGKRLFKEDQKELIEKIGLKDARGRIQKSIGQLNAYLIENFNMNLISKQVKIDGKKKVVWVLSEVK